MISNNIDGEVYFSPEAICSRAESSTDLDPDDVRCNDGSRADLIENEQGDSS
jgi:hypothetical protein